MAGNDAIEVAISQGEAMEREDPEGAIAWFTDLAERYPGDARVLFAYAGALDFAGREAEAVAPYRRAREAGLPDELLPRWFVQLGSTLRNVGAHQEAVSLLEDGQRRYPGDVAIACFLALARQSAGDPARALRTALEAILTEARQGHIDVRGYQRALAWYAADLTGEAEE